MKNPLLLFPVILCAGSVASEAATIGYWRMEVDNDAGAGVSVPNEIAGGNPLLAPTASISNDAAVAPGVPVAIIPQTGASNGFSLNGSAEIDGTVAFYSALSTSGSLTLELWARTVEGAGSLISRGDGVAAGFLVTNFGALEIRYATDNGSGGATANTLLFGLDLDTAWRHVAFTYDAASGLGRTYVDGDLKNSNDGPDGRALVWNNSALSVGLDMDGGSSFTPNASGYVDEVRLSDTALAPSQFLNAVPEPSTAVALLGGAAILIGRRRRQVS